MTSGKKYLGGSAKYDFVWQSDKGGGQNPRHNLWMAPNFKKVGMNFQINFSRILINASNSVPNLIMSLDHV